MGSRQYEVPVEKLRWECDPNQFGFECTDEITPLEEFIGQDRAIKAIEFGLAVDKPGYNIFVTGLTGTGRTSAIKAHLQKVVAAREAEGVRYHPEDWCYLYSLRYPDRPQVIRLPKGKGRSLREQVEGLLQTLKGEIAKAFSGEEYDKQRKAIMEESQGRQQQLFRRFQEEAAEKGFAVQFSPMGVVLVPLLQGRPATQAEYMALDESTKETFQERRGKLTRRVEETMEEAHVLERETAERMGALDRKIGQFAVARPFDELLRQYKSYPEVARYLEELRAYTLDNIDQFKEQEGQPPASFGLPGTRLPRERDPFLAFKVNVFVDNSETEGPAIVLEPNPTYSKMFGMIERRPIMGAYFTDHTMLKPGAVSLANGGYLVLNARDVLINPGVWEGLKRVIKNKSLQLEDPFEQFGLVAPHGLRPQPIPTDVKVVVTGDRALYQLLSIYDEDFWEIFKVKADFDSQIERNHENTEAYAAFICACCKNERLLPFHRTGVAKVVEYGSRLVADQGRISSRFGQIKDLLIEADYWARKSSSPLVRAEHVKKALEEKVFRSNLVEQRLRELIQEGTIIVDTEGAVAGQVNGLAVLDLGDLSFGKPSRITARVFMGRRGVINIERESQLSGRIHDKGVLILSGYLGWKYAQDKPLSLSASVCFEQSYEGVEGDSASSTELYAILSSLSGLPINQSIAVTGSVNQKGEVQPIGGVNEKVEGFFDLCKAKGLTGQQGVIIPHQNVKNLMLREEVVGAVKGGQFHIYAVKTIDEGIEILTGHGAGERREDGSYPKGSVNYLVDQRLRELAEGLKGFYGESRAGEG